MNRALRSLPLAVLLVLAACSSEETGGADAQQLPGSDAAVADTGQEQPGADAASVTPDAASAGADAASAGPDAGPDAGTGSPAEARVESASDALASYLVNASPAEWNIFSGTTVPLGRHWDTDHVSYNTALRFASLAVPQGATVTSAKLTFTPGNAVDSSHNLWINVYAEKTADSAAFDPTNYDSGRPDQRLRTTAKIDHWLVRCNDSCTDLSEYDCPQRKLDCWDPATAFTCPKDLKALVQEVVDQPEWASGNALTLLLINVATDEDGANYQDSRSIVGYDAELGASAAPRLVVEFTP